MRSRHLDYPPGAPAETLGAAALDELLDRGDLDDWAPLVRAIRSDPAGPLAETVLRLVDAHPMYGTSTLWRTWIEGLRRAAPAPAAARDAPAAQGLAALRRARGLSQETVGARMGISQSDVSKLERRGDIRLSTLRAYVRATGGRLALRVRYGKIGPETELTIGEARDGGDRAQTGDRGRGAVRRSRSGPRRRGGRPLR